MFMIVDYSTNQILHFKIIDNSGKIHPSVCSFSIQFWDNEITTKIMPRLSASSDWIKFILLPKLIKWAEEANSADTFQHSNNGSLKLIPVDRYNELYLHWKEKYGKSLVEVNIPVQLYNCSVDQQSTSIIEI